MAEFSKLVITNKGQALLTKTIAGEGTIQFIKTSASDAEYALEQIEALTELSNVKQTVPVSKVTRTDDTTVTIEIVFDNTALAEGYHMRTLGLYAMDPDEGEILYAVTTENSGCCYMPADNGVTVSGAYIKLVTTVGNAENVSLEVDPGVYVTVGEIKELKECISGLEAWKDNTQKRLDNWGPTITGHGQIINSLRESIGNLKPVATSGSYDDLENKPDLKAVATSGNYDDLTNKPNLKAVATSGNYDDLTNKPVIPAAVRIKGNAESSYRTGDVNLTAANIGAVNKAGDTVTGVLNFNDNGIKIANKALKDYIATMAGNNNWVDTSRDVSGWTQPEGYTYVDFANGTRILAMQVLSNSQYSRYLTDDHYTSYGNTCRIKFPVNFRNSDFYVMFMYDQDKSKDYPVSFHIYGKTLNSVRVNFYKNDIFGKNFEYLIESIWFWAIGRWK